MVVGSVHRHFHLISFEAIVGFWWHLPDILTTRVFAKFRAWSRCDLMCWWFRITSFTRIVRFWWNLPRIHVCTTHVYRSISIKLRTNPRLFKEEAAAIRLDVVAWSNLLKESYYFIETLFAQVLWSADWSIDCRRFTSAMKRSADGNILEYLTMLLRSDWVLVFGYLSKELSDCNGSWLVCLLSMYLAQVRCSATSAIFV